MCGWAAERDSTEDKGGTLKERLVAALAENDRLRGDLARRHVLSIVYPSGYASTTAPSGPVVGPFRLDDKPVSVKWTKAGLRVGCHVITREALEALAKVEE